MTAVTLSNLSKAYAADTAAVDSISLEIQSGEMIALLGPSGCGKTTTLKMIAGLIEPSGGDIQFDSISVLGLPPERRGAVMVFQNHLLFAFMTVAENVGFGLKMRGISESERNCRVKETLESVHLGGFEKRRPADLSGGQKQRVALARALITKPRLLLLDEPLSNLDAHLRMEMRSLIHQLQRESGITTIFVTHDQQEAVMLSDRTALIFDGVLQQVGAPRDFYERPVSERVARFFGTENFLSGQKTGDRVETSLGVIQLNGTAAPDGPVTLAVRPEAVEIGEYGPNRVSGTVQSALYVGTGMELVVKVDECASGIKVRTGTQFDWRAGLSIRLSLPSARIIVIAGDSGRHD
jgi:ABC-type Fe3+/spermidine/putrescine transport system ATPase subunit